MMIQWRYKIIQNNTRTVSSAAGRLSSRFSTALTTLPRMLPRKLAKKRRRSAVKTRFWTRWMKSANVSGLKSATARPPASRTSYERVLEGVAEEIDKNSKSRADMDRKTHGYIELLLVWRQGSEFQNVYSSKIPLVEYLSGLGGLFSLWLGVSILNFYDVLLQFSSKFKTVLRQAFRARKRRQERRPIDICRNANGCPNLGRARRRHLATPTRANVFLRLSRDKTCIILWTFRIDLIESMNCCNVVYIKCNFKTTISENKCNKVQWCLWLW